jgi:hypothetical protein
MLSFATIEENKRTVKTEKSSYAIILDRSRSLWSIKPESGPLPKILEGEWTTPHFALTAISNYLDSHKTRKAV